VNLKYKPKPKINDTNHVRNSSTFNAVLQLFCHYNSFSMPVIYVQFWYFVAKTIQRPFQWTDLQLWQAGACQSSK